MTELRGTSEERYHWALRLVEAALPLIEDLRAVSAGDSDRLEVCAAADGWLDDHHTGPSLAIDPKDAFLAGYDAGHDEAMWGGWRRYPVRYDESPSPEDFATWWLTIGQLVDD